jgi:hypothetical protein
MVNGGFSHYDYNPETSDLNRSPENSHLNLPELHDHWLSFFYSHGVNVPKWAVFPLKSDKRNGRGSVRPFHSLSEYKEVAFVGSRGCVPVGLHKLNAELGDKKAVGLALCQAEVVKVGGTFLVFDIEAGKDDFPERLLTGLIGALSREEWDKAVRYKAGELAVVETPSGGFHFRVLLRQVWGSEAVFKFPMGKVEVFSHSRAVYPLSSSSRKPYVILLKDFSLRKATWPKVIATTPVLNPEQAGRLWNFLMREAEEVIEKTKKPPREGDGSHAVFATLDEWEALLNFLGVSYRRTRDGLEVFSPFIYDGSKPGLSVFYASNGNAIYYDHHQDLPDHLRCGDIATFYQNYRKVVESVEISRAQAVKELKELLGEQIYVPGGSKLELTEHKVIELPTPETTDKREKQKGTGVEEAEEEAEVVVVEPEEVSEGVEVLGYTFSETTTGNSVALVLRVNGKVRRFPVDRLGPLTLRVLGFAVEQGHEGEDKEKKLKEEVRRLKEELLEKALAKGEVDLEDLLRPGIQKIKGNLALISGRNIYVAEGDKLFIYRSGVYAGKVVGTERFVVDEEALAEGFRRGGSALREAYEFLLSKMKTWEMVGHEVLTAEVLMAPFGAVRSWKPLVFITGKRGTGKTTLLNLVHDFWGPFALLTVDVSASGLAGLFRDRGYIVLIHDEVSRARKSSELMDILVASTTAKASGVVRGTAGGGYRESKVPFTVFLAGVHNPARDDQQETRFLAFRLTGFKAPEPPRVDEEEVERLRSLAIGALLRLWSRVEAEAKEVRRKGTFATRRMADNVAYALGLLRVIGIHEVKLPTELEEHSLADEQRELIDLIASTRVRASRVGSEQPIADLVLLALNGSREAEHDLEAVGIYLHKGNIVINASVLYNVLRRQSDEFARMYPTRRAFTSGLKLISTGQPHYIKVGRHERRIWAWLIPLEVFLDEGTKDLGEAEKSGKS